MRPRRCRPLPVRPAERRRGQRPPRRGSRSAEDRPSASSWAVLPPRVDPSTSVSRKVTVPVGRAKPAAFGPLTSSTKSFMVPSIERPRLGDIPHLVDQWAAPSRTIAASWSSFSGTTDSLDWRTSALVANTASAFISASVTPRAQRANGCDVDPHPLAGIIGRIGIARSHDFGESDCRLVGLRVVHDDGVALGHRPHVELGLRVGHAVPMRAALAHEVGPAVLAGLRLHQPARHAQSAERGRVQLLERLPVPLGRSLVEGRVVGDREAVGSRIGDQRVVTPAAVSASDIRANASSSNEASSFAPPTYTVAVIAPASR